MFVINLIGAILVALTAVCLGLALGFKVKEGKAATIGDIKTALEGFEAFGFFGSLFGFPAVFGFLLPLLAGWEEEPLKRGIGALTAVLVIGWIGRENTLGKGLLAVGIVSCLFILVAIFDPPGLLIFG